MVHLWKATFCLLFFELFLKGSFLYIRLCRFRVPKIPYAEKTAARLVHGTSEAGRLEIFFNGEWTTVCNTEFGDEEAKVACKMLGLNSTGAAVVSSVVYGAGSGTILLDGLDCQGTESSLERCHHRGLYKHFCRHSNDVSIICSIELRLRGRRRTRQDMGVVEMKTGSAWQAVCVSDVQTATVACRQLSLPTRASVPTVGLSSGPRPSSALKISFTCTGHESNLFHCGQNVDGYKSDCDLNDVGVFCIQYQPLIRISPTNNLSATTGNPNLFEIPRGQDVTFRCEVDSNPPPASITWSGTVRNTTGELWITAAGKRHSGVYTCTAVTQTVDDDDDERLPLKSTHQITIVVKDLTIAIRSAHETLIIISSTYCVKLLIAIFFTLSGMPSCLQGDNVL